jgi:hypothetical protein
MGFNRAATNREIAQRLDAVRAQIGRIHDEISFLTAMVSVQPMDDQFNNYDVKDRITILSMAVSNNAAEMDKLWKLTRG